MLGSVKGCYSGDTNIRKGIYKRRALRVVNSCNESDIFINYPCVFTAHTRIGHNCHFNGMTVNGSGEVIIHDNFHSGHDCKIITQNHNYDTGTKLPYDNTYIIKSVIIGKNVWLGDSVIILPGTVIGDGVVVQAGSVVHGNIPPLSIIGGNPAVVIKYRDKDHYDRLERDKQYF